MRATSGCNKFCSKAIATAVTVHANATQQSRAAAFCTVAGGKLIRLSLPAESIGLDSARARFIDRCIDTSMVMRIAIGLRPVGGFNGPTETDWHAASLCLRWADCGNTRRGYPEST